MSATSKQPIGRRSAAANLWLSHDAVENEHLATLLVNDIRYEVHQSEEAVGRAMFEEIADAAATARRRARDRDSGWSRRSGFASSAGRTRKSNADDVLLSRLHVFTQDALAPLRMHNGLSFVRDFERLLGEDFFRKVKTLTLIRIRDSGCECIQTSVR